jgi:hypothetical protein
MKRDTKGQAERTGLRPKTLENWRSLRIGPPYYKLGARVMYDDAETDAWLAEHRVNPGTKSAA